MSDSAAKHRARQTVVNLVLALAACVIAVVLIVISVPRDESNRIKAVEYSKIVAEAKTSTNLDLISINPISGWWCNLANLKTASSDGVQQFEAGFVGSDVKYIGYTQAFSANATWLAFKLGKTTITGTYKTWDIYQAVIPNDPKQTMDYIMVHKYGNENYVLLYGVADQSDFESFADEITNRLSANTSND